MSYGTLFVPPESRPKANLGKLYDEMIDIDIKSRVKRPDYQLDKESQDLGRLFHVGTDVAKNFSHLSKNNRIKHNSSYFDEIDSVSSSKKKEVKHRVKHVLTATEALIADGRREGGKYHYNNRYNPYETAVEVLHLIVIS